MNNKKIIFAILMLCCGVLSSRAQNSRQQISFNSGWFFHQGDVVDAHLESSNYIHWQTVLLPHTWNDKDVLADNQRGYYRGISWYKRAFILSSNPQKRYFLRFEGVNQVCEVYINGQLAGSHIGGYTAFNIDITPFLKASGKQVVAIKVDNSFNENIPPLSADFTFFGGIYRPVYLITTEQQAFSMNDDGSSGIYISTPHVDDREATVQVSYHVTNYADLSRKVELRTGIRGKDTLLYQNKQEITLPPNGDTVLRILIDHLSGFKLWSPESPAMYYVESSLHSDGKEVDFLTEPLGFRWFRFDADKGFFLNGKPVKLMGANRHQDRIPYGNALTYDMH
ncbi:MAG TPA: glycoside hydrolase family 2, partial [Sphingobacterium sp.]|nr:glycoside hydrolase family 2 [Sphingobacterium sp.]